jgi:uncharacterized repeat protein (TIGR01451 family)
VVARFFACRLLAIAAFTALTAMVPWTAPTAVQADTAEVELTLSSPTVAPGGTLTVTAKLHNVNPFTVLNPAARLFSAPDALPGYATLNGCTGAASCTTITDGASRPIGYQATLAQAMAGFSTATVTFSLTISATAPGGQQTLRGQLFGSNYASEIMDGPVLTIDAKSDVAVDLAATPRLGLLVPKIDFTVKITNGGPDRLQSATVTTALPAGLTATSSECAAGSGNVVCTFGALPTGSAATARFSLPLRLLNIGIPYTFTATRTASSPRDPVSGNDVAAIRCTVVTPLLVTCR